MKTKLGRPSLFTPKDGGKAHHILALTAEGEQLFDDARARLKALAKWPGNVSDADVVEMLVRGEKATRAYLKAKRT